MMSRKPKKRAIVRVEQMAYGATICESWPTCTLFDYLGQKKMYEYRDFGVIADAIIRQGDATTIARIDEFIQRIRRVNPGYRNFVSQYTETALCKTLHVEDCMGNSCTFYNGETVLFWESVARTNENVILPEILKDMWLRGYVEKGRFYLDGTTGRMEKVASLMTDL